MVPWWYGRCCELHTRTGGHSGNLRASKIVVREQSVELGVNAAASMPLDIPLAPSSIGAELSGVSVTPPEKCTVPDNLLHTAHSDAEIGTVSAGSVS